MKPFKKDILIVDFEVTGFDFEKDEPIQIGILLLDRKNLKEKMSFISWIKPEQNLYSELSGFKWANINKEDILEIAQSQSLKVIAKQIDKLIPDQYILCAWNATFDFIFWNKILSHINKKIHAVGILDLWTLSQPYLLNDKNYKGNYNSESVFQYFGANARKKHDALEDCKIEAMVLRKLLNSYKNQNNFN